MSEIDLKEDIEEAQSLLEPHATRLKGLVQLWNIFTSAKTIADEYYKEFDNLSYPLKVASTKGLVVDYFKPWSGNYSEELNSLRVFSTSKKWSYPFLDRIIGTHIHQSLEEVRNRMVAHIDKDFEGLGVTVKGATVANKPAHGQKQEGTLENVFLPATIMLTSNRGMWWLSDKDKLGEICDHINETKKLVEEEIRVSTSIFRDLCMDHMHVLKNMSDIIGVEELPFQEGNIDVTSPGELPKPFYSSMPISTMIGDENIQSLITVYAPRPAYPTNIDIKGKGYILKLGNVTDQSKLEMQVVFPKYPYPKENVNET